ncbi:tetratricopeptide repeat protein [Lentzea sp.]|uniref:tetratricopeptide repeat protein n=1 Tax=Lentzea sp. TaxID=56099 RepID=UPI002BC3D7B5|nr:tetratricopeptide repeat protein [Lentzea sp.]HUQ56627.1 tetratricopeptide repeat protein [Lentzea sp.]
MEKSEPLRVFVAMPGEMLGEHTQWTDTQEIKDDLYEDVRVMLEKRLGKAVEMQIEKERQKSGSIHHSMYGEALTAPVYIADLTGANANVYLELGARWALRDNVTIITCQHKADLRFNADTYRYAQYGQGPKELRAAKDLIVNMIVNGLDDLDHVDNPVRSGRDLVVFSRAELTKLRGEIARLEHARGDDLFREAMSAEGDHRIAKLQYLLTINDARADAHGELGKALLAKRLFGEAVVRLDAATRLQPGVADWWRALGVAQSRKGDYTAAVASLSEAVRLNPMDADAYSSLGGAHRRIARESGDRSELVKARDCYRKAGEIKDDDLYSLANLARLDVLLAEDAEAQANALRSFRRLHTLATWLTEDKHAPWAWLDRAETSAFRGEAEAAMDALRTGLEQLPESERAGTAEVAVGPLRDTVAVTWLDSSITDTLRAMLDEYRTYL